MFCKLLICLLFFLQISENPTFPYRYIYIKRWLRVNQVFNIRVHIFCILLVSVLQEVDWFDIALVGAPRWAGSKDSESHTLSTMSSEIKIFCLTALDLSSNDEQTVSLAEHWPRFITLERVPSDSQPKSLTKMSPFLIQIGIQWTVGTPKSVKKLKSGVLLIEATKKQHSTSLLDLKL